MENRRNSRMMLPKMSEKLLSRTALITKIQKGFNKQVTVLEAGAGHGKTTALRQAMLGLADNDWSWLTLSESTNHLTTFWSYLLESMQPLFQEQDEDTAAYFQRCVTESSLADFGYYLIDLLPAQDRYLVLDDFHMIDEENLVASLDKFLAALPDTLHIFLVTRYKPAVYLGKLLLDNQLQYIQEDDFLLSEDEAYSLIAKLEHKHIPMETQQALIETASGWLGGLQILLLSGNYSFSKHCSGIEQRILFDYLTREILDNLPLAKKQFLIETAYYPFVFAGLSQTFFPETSYLTMQQNLQSENLMITFLDDDRMIYHPLIRASLVEAFLKQAPAEVERKKRLAAQVFLAHDYFDEGLTLLFDVAAYEEIMPLLVAEPQNLRTSFYIQKVPDTAALTNIDFAFQKLFYYYASLDYTAIGTLISQLEAHYPQMAKIQAFTGMRLLMGIDFTKVDLVILSIEAVRELPLNNVSKAFIMLKNAMICYYQNAFKQALRFVEESIHLNKEKQNPFIGYFNQTFMAQIYEEIGDFQQGLALLKQTYAHLDEFHVDAKVNANYYLSFHLTIAGIYLKKMDLDLAEQSLAPLADQRQTHMRASYLYNYAELLYLQGKPTEALQIIEQLNMTEYYQNLRMKSGLFRYMLKQQQLSDEKQQQLIQEYRQQKSRSISNQLFYGMLLVEQGELAAALEAAEQIIEISRKERIYFRIIGGDLFKIDVLLHMHPLDERLLSDLYHEAIHYGQEYQIVSEFYLYQKELCQLFQQLGERLCENFDPAEQAFHQKIVALVFPETAIQLSKREQQVLAEIAKGFTNKEIAENLYISMATTKTHILNIYRKLAVNSRVSAIEEARRLGLLK